MEEEKPKVHARVIIDMMGAPKEHIVQTMELLIKKIDTDDNVTLVEAETAEPIEKESMWSLFSEIEITVKDIQYLIGFCFDYMPSSVEIIKPDKFRFDSLDFAGVLNDVQARLHQIDMILKGINAENKLLKKNGSMLLNNMVLLLLKEGEKDIDALAKGTGIPGDQLKQFLDVLTKGGRIKEIAGKYSLAK